MQNDLLPSWQNKLISFPSPILNEKTITMQNRTSKELFDLVKGMSKWEKKNFNRYAKRNTSAESLKVITLFKVLNEMGEYNEKNWRKKLKACSAGKCLT